MNAPDIGKSDSRVRRADSQLNTSWAQAEDALRFLRKYFKPTRLVLAPSLMLEPDSPVYLKLESEMPTGSFKVRGALYALSLQREKAGVTEVVAASTGNHGAAVAYAASLLGLRAQVFLPSDPNPVKRSTIRRLGAGILEKGRDISDARQCAREYAERTDAFLLDDATNADLPAGTATIGMEIVSELPDVEAVWVPIGDSALIRGLATGVKRMRSRARVLGVQAEAAPAYYLSWKRGHRVTTEDCSTIADGLATRTPVEENVTSLRELVDDIRLVTEEQMLAAIRHLLLNERIIAEPSGAASVAAWMARQPRSSSGPTVLLISGANIAEDVLQRALCGY
jgi:threonine dehydratase